MMHHKHYIDCLYTVAYTFFHTKVFKFCSPFYWSFFVIDCIAKMFLLAALWAFTFFPGLWYRNLFQPGLVTSCQKIKESFCSSN